MNFHRPYHEGQAALHSRIEEGDSKSGVACCRNDYSRQKRAEWSAWEIKCWPALRNRLTGNRFALEGQESLAYLFAATFAYTGCVFLLRILTAVLLLSSCAFSGGKQEVPLVRWTENAPNCTFRQTDDGRSYYGLSSANFDVTLAVDRQELEKIPHRATPMLGVFLTFHYKGAGQFEVQQNRFTLEFVKHFQVTPGSLDPDDVVKHLQDNIDDLTDEIERHQVKKHPEQKQEKETELQARLKDYTEMMDFVSTRALRPATLDGSNSSASGWVFFGVRNKWIGPWRRPEQFVLRMPVENFVVEFPFSLPPQAGKIELRRRPGE